jgi:hypothetical protein
MVAGERRRPAMSSNGADGMRSSLRKVVTTPSSRRASGTTTHGRFSREAVAVTKMSRYFGSGGQAVFVTCAPQPLAGHETVERCGVSASTAWPGPISGAATVGRGTGPLTISVTRRSSSGPPRLASPFRSRAWSGPRLALRRSRHRSSTTSSRGWEQQMRTLPSAGGSTGSGL